MAPQAPTRLSQHRPPPRPRSRHPSPLALIPCSLYQQRRHTMCSVRSARSTGSHACASSQWSASSQSSLRARVYTTQQREERVGEEEYCESCGRGGGCNSWHARTPRQLRNWPPQALRVRGHTRAKCHARECPTHGARPEQPGGSQSMNARPKKLQFSCLHLLSRRGPQHT